MIDPQVYTSIELDTRESDFENPEWVWYTKDEKPTFSRWANGVHDSPYIRGDLVPIWRDIGSAPKDGRLILLWCPNSGYEIARWYGPWECWILKGETPSDPENEERYGIGSKVPTHWMNLHTPNGRP